MPDSSSKFAWDCKLDCSALSFGKYKYNCLKFTCAFLQIQQRCLPKRSTLYFGFVPSRFMWCKREDVWNILLTAWYDIWLRTCIKLYNELFYQICVKLAPNIARFLQWGRSLASGSFSSLIWKWSSRLINEELHIEVKHSTQTRITITSIVLPQHGRWVGNMHDKLVKRCQKKLVLSPSVSKTT